MKRSPIRSTATPRFSRRPAARPDELIAAALTVFSERGFRQTTLEEVAARAGVSKGTVYLYFESKDDLFRAVVETKVVVLLEEVEAFARSHAGTATELLIHVIHRMWQALSRTDMVCMAHLVQSELGHFPEIRRFYFEQVVQRHRRLLGEIVARGIAAGEFRPEAALIVPRMVPSLVVHLNQSRFLFGDLETRPPASDDVRDAVVALVLEGIRRPQAAPRTRARSTTARRKKARG
ncbi:MAG TPA: TetR/AcrR family transcriptional regulator [Gemmatimonadales bacterium]|nr:TetR/AcrR family transcriptional regulator [Gemmatimonadales bacterium]